MKIKGEKTIATVICIMGVVGVAYGVGRDNNAVFIVGLLFVVGGYLMIRRKLKGNGKTKIR